LELFLTKRENEVLELIRSNPMISQQELAEKLGISRSAAAGHIMNLTTKGYIAGKGYVLNESPYAVVIGGSNMDILGTPAEQFVTRDSNPGTITLSPGGVGRNIAENLARLGTDVKLLTILGDDVYGEKILDSCRNCGIDMNHAKISSKYNTSVYLSILDGNGDMISAVSDMQLMEELNRDYLESKNKIINGASLLILDANLSEPVLNYLTEKYGKIIDIFVDTVSTTKAKKIKPLLKYIHTLKPNMFEAEILCDGCASSETSENQIADKLLSSGVQRVFLSLGEKGVLYKDLNNSDYYNAKQVKPVNTTGAGDAYTAALAYAYMNDYTIKRTLAFAGAAARLAVLSKETINKEISAKKIEKMIEGEI
jgi:pseudouridine kinase